MVPTINSWLTHKINTIGNGRKKSSLMEKQNVLDGAAWCSQTGGQWNKLFVITLVGYVLCWVEWDVTSQSTWLNLTLSNILHILHCIMKLHVTNDWYECFRTSRCQIFVKPSSSWSPTFRILVKSFLTSDSDSSKTIFIRFYKTLKDK